MTPEELRAAMRSAQPSGKGQYIEDGRHYLKIDKAIYKRTLVGATAKESWIIEFKVIESTNTTHEVNSTRSYVENPQNAGWDGRFMACLLAAIGVDPASPSANAPDVRAKLGDIMVAIQYDEERKRMGLPENFLAGLCVYCEGFAGKSRGGTPVTNKKWTPAPPPAAKAA